MEFYQKVVAFENQVEVEDSINYKKNSLATYSSVTKNIILTLFKTALRICGKIK